MARPSAEPTVVQGQVGECVGEADRAAGASTCWSSSTARSACIRSTSGPDGLVSAKAAWLRASSSRSSPDSVSAWSHSCGDRGIALLRGRDARLEQQARHAMPDPGRSVRGRPSRGCGPGTVSPSRNWQLGRDDGATEQVARSPAGVGAAWPARPARQRRRGCPAPGPAQRRASKCGRDRCRRGCCAEGGMPGVLLGVGHDLRQPSMQLGVGSPALRLAVRRSSRSGGG